MSEIVRSCPLCGASGARLFDRREFRGLPVENHICRTCGFVYQSPRMTEAERQDFYREEYRQLYQGQAGPNPKEMVIQYARAGSILEFIMPYIPQLTNILDIGCSTGALLQQLQMVYQAHPYGIEPGDLYRHYAQGLNMQVYPTIHDLPSTSLKTFDMVSLMHVLEHLPDPVDYLQHLREKFLQPKGWLLLEVPNLFAHDCFEVAHLTSFSPHTLNQVVRRAGFNVTQLRLHGMPRSKLIPLYITLLAQPDGAVSAPVKPDHLVSLKRQIGFLRRRLVTRLFHDQAWLPI